MASLNTTTSSILIRASTQDHGYSMQESPFTAPSERKPLQDDAIDNGVAGRTDLLCVETTQSPHTKVTTWIKKNDFTTPPPVQHNGSKTIPLSATHFNTLCDNYLYNKCNEPLVRNQIKESSILLRKTYKDKMKGNTSVVFTPLAAGLHRNYITSNDDSSRVQSICNARIISPAHSETHKSELSALHLSPESTKMKEFYSYLKIDTNPSARKLESVNVQRRSKRVKRQVLETVGNGSGAADTTIRDGQDVSECPNVRLVPVVVKLNGASCKKRLTEDVKPSKKSLRLLPDSSGRSKDDVSCLDERNSYLKFYESARSLRRLPTTNFDDAIELYVKTEGLKVPVPKTKNCRNWEKENVDCNTTVVKNDKSMENIKSTVSNRFVPTKTLKKRPHNVATKNLILKYSRRCLRSSQRTRGICSANNVLIKNLRMSNKKRMQRRKDFVRRTIGNGKTTAARKTQLPQTLVEELSQSKIVSASDFMKFETVKLADFASAAAISTTTSCYDEVTTTTQGFSLSGSSSLPIEINEQVDQLVVKLEASLPESAIEISSSCAIESFKNEPKNSSSTECSTCTANKMPDEQDGLDASNITSSTNGDLNTGTTEYANDADAERAVPTATSEIVNPESISPKQSQYIPLPDNIEPKSLHKSLVQTKRSKPNVRQQIVTDVDFFNQPIATDCDTSNQLIATSKVLNKKKQLVPAHSPSSHSIQLLSIQNGNVLYATYLDNHLILAQERSVGFWNHSALGQVLGAQNMWVPMGRVQRLVLGAGCEPRASREMAMCCDDSVAYLELWTKEHKSDKRERPVTDVFVTVYFCKRKEDKKVLQLENIKGAADSVQYVVMKHTRNVVVSWRFVTENETKTLIRLYHLEEDYQTVASTKEMKSVANSVVSLHNIGNCDTLVMGAGENNINIWNLEFGYLVATVQLQQFSYQPVIMWASCDRGYLFIVQQFAGNLLQLVAINGINYNWKSLQTYRPPPQKDQRLRGVAIQGGVLVGFLESELLCWNMQTGRMLLEDKLQTDLHYMPVNEHVILIDNEQVQVKGILSCILSS